MDICFDVSGHRMNDGLESWHGTEGRWAFEWARLLALKGHQCHLLVGKEFSAGRYPLPKNITPIVDGVLNKNYDVFFTAGDLKQWYGDMKTKLFIGLLLPYPDRYDGREKLLFRSNWVIGAHTHKTKGLFITESNSLYGKTRMMPTPLAQSFGQNHFDNNLYLFPHRYYRDTYLYAMAYFIKKHKLRLGIMHQDVFNKFIAPKQLGNSSLSSMLDGVSIEYYDSMPKEQSDQILERSRFIFASGAEGGIFSIESVLAGILPFPSDTTKLYFGDSDKILYPGFDYGFDLTDDLTAQAISEVWEQPYKDQDFYKKALGLYQEAVSYHLYDNAYKSFLDITKDFI